VAEEKGHRPSEPPLSCQGRIVLDPASGVIRSWFQPEASPIAAPPFSPLELARDVCRQSAARLRWDPSLPDLAEQPVISVAGSLSVRFVQQFKGVPVWASEVLVNARVRPCPPGRRQQGLQPAQLRERGGGGLLRLPGRRLFRRQAREPGHPRPHLDLGPNDQVEALHLVAFDNNIALRDVTVQ
jgi:hypothetical protein